MRRCIHGIYNPDPESERAWSCTACYPEGHPESPAPILPRSSSDPLNSRRTAPLEKCECGAIVLSIRLACNVCGQPYAKLFLGRQQQTANEKQPGVCPDCGSNVHYEGKSGVWVCADCETEYQAPKGRKHK